MSIIDSVDTIDAPAPHYRPSPAILARRPSAEGYLLSVVAPYPVFLLLNNAPSEPAVFGMLIALGALCGVFAGISPGMMSELFPTTLRTTGVSVSFGLSTAIFGGFA